ncbi:MAG: 50S ribosomal protein L21 [Christensenellaceae bacterium]|jgi:large subunit ribosomal protein L21|nr:50S ribosomal protein L21 [Christensenellaceae bacterium]
MFAIIQTGGKQFRVQNGDVIYIEKLNAQEGDTVAFDVLVYEDGAGEISVGAPTVEGVKAQGKILGHGRGEKILILKYKSKKNYRRRQGHRQPFTKVEIMAIG